MTRFPRTGVWLAAGLLMGALASVAPGQTVQKERAWELLDGLRQRGHYDLAARYLDQLKTSPRCPDDLMEVIDYQAGLTLASGAAQLGTPQAQQQQFGQARDRFQEFLKEHPDHALAAAAETQVANVLVERGQLQMRLAEQPSRSTEEKARLHGEAREFFQQAQAAFTSAERSAYERAKALEGLLDPEKDADKIAQRDQARSDLLEARLYLAGADYEIGKTYPPDAKVYQETLAKAAQQYHELYEKYGSFGGGLYARMQEGRIYKELGESDKAIDVLKEMLTLPDTARPFRLLRNQSLVLLLETYLLPGVKQYEDAIAGAAAWAGGAPDAEKSSTEGLAIRYLGGVAAADYAESLPPRDPRRQAPLVAAREHFDFVARFPGEYQRKAHARLLSFSANSQETQATSAPADYAEAKQRGDFAWATMVVAMGQSQQAADAQARAKAASQASEARGEAITSYRATLGMRDTAAKIDAAKIDAAKIDEVEIDEVNLTRLRLAYLYLLEKDYYRAAVMGGFLATRYPNAAGAAKGAEIAVKAYRMIYHDAVEHGRDAAYEFERMSQIAAYVTARWPGQPEAQEVWTTLIDVAVQQHDLTAALAYLEKIPADSPQRAEAELRTGQAMWYAYVTGSAKEGDQRPEQSELDALAAQAEATLEKGVERIRQAVDAGSQTPTLTLAYSMLSLAQIRIGKGESAEAVQLLDDPKFGPVTLVEAQNPLVRGNEQFALDTYKAALRAYVGAEMLDKAEGVMAALEKIVSTGGDAEARRRVTKTYIQLGVELQEMLKRLREEKKTDALRRVSAGFELFLNKISEREEGNNFNSLNWVAETFFGLGAGMDPGGKTLPDEAKRYYLSAAKTYKRILDEIAANPDFARPGADVSVKVRLAACSRALGHSETAMKILLPLLKENENRLDVQIEAARTYQAWGRQQPGHYATAISGGEEEGGRRLVWGWSGIARRLAPHYNKYESTFHEARYNLALCRLELALSRSGADRVETLKQAKLDVTRVHQLYPTLGGPERFSKYDTLLKTIQKLLGEPATGLTKAASGKP